MRRIFIALLCAAALTSCAARAIKEGMNPMVGQPLGAAVAKLGFPTEERTIAGQKVYIWLDRILDEGTEFKCQVRVIMQGDIIASFDFEGQELRCARFAAKLRS